MVDLKFALPNKTRRKQKDLIWAKGKSAKNCMKCIQNPAQHTVWLHMHVLNDSYILILMIRNVGGSIDSRPGVTAKTYISEFYT